MNRKDKKDEISDIELDNTVLETMKYTGWIIPQDADEVLRAEKILSENPVSIPEELSTPEAVLERPSKKIFFRYKTIINSSIEQNIARAAREGGKISPEVLEKMRKDRENAERKSNK